LKLSARFEEALVYATRLHAGQLRKGSEVLYISHLLSVTALVLENGGNEDEAIAALLHDAIEDQGGDVTRKEIRRCFGATVEEIVSGCSDTDIFPKPPWRVRKEAYLKHLPEASKSILLVSAADKLHNLRSILNDYRQIGDALWPRFKSGKDGMLWYYPALLAVYQVRIPSPMIEEMARVMQELITLVNIAQ
jgi:(p)ppGpp synthase/HD superfamily hydrolase